MGPVNHDVQIGPSGTLDINSPDYQLEVALTVDSPPVAVAGPGRPMSAYTGPIQSGLGSMVSNSAGNSSFGNVSTGTIFTAAEGVGAAHYNAAVRDVALVNRVAVDSTMILLGGAHRGLQWSLTQYGHYGAAQAGYGFYKQSNYVDGLSLGHAVYTAAGRGRSVYVDTLVGGVIGSLPRN